MKRRGKFIVIEGIDGSGKSTQVSMLKDRIERNSTEEEIKNKWYFTKEATDSPIGKLIRNTYLSGERKCDEKVINILYAADRFDHVFNDEDGILKYLNQGINVICDRFYLSSMAYNSYMMDSDSEVISMMNHTVNMNKYIMDVLKPDLTIYIDIKPSVSLNRLKENRDNISVYETSDKLTKIYITYDIAMDILRDRFNEIIVTINGNKSMKDINDKIYELITEILN